MPQPKPLLKAGEPIPHTKLDGDAPWPCLLVSDHASARIPAELGDLGLGREALASHLACDLGSGALTKELAAAMNLPAVLCNYSRLVVDCNRSLDDPTAFLTFSDGTRITGNCDLSHADRKRRADAIYWPYHEAVAAALRELETAGQRAILISIHSFTPVLDGIHRPWDAGLLWDKDERLAQALLDGLSLYPELRVGDNVPYSGRSSADFTVDYHGEAADRAHVALEIRQDHLATATGISAWAERLARVLAKALDEPANYAPRPAEFERQKTLRAAAQVG
ncbi:MAG: N-formylglutamate amidohydrolase [Pseudomonadota bacterium]